jgi:flavodoxin
VKTLIIYDSNLGNTKLIAEEIAQKLDGDAKAVSVSDFNKSDLSEASTVIFGSPIIGWRPTEKMIAFMGALGHDSLKEKKATAFDTRIKLFIHGDAKMKMVKTLEDLGAEIFITPEHFFVKGKEGPLFDGEVERAGGWAKEINSKI